METPLPKRDYAIDLLRGLVMVIMVLDHTRDFFFGGTSKTTDLTQTYELLFFTRWITHFCAPTFLLLAGISAALYMKKHTSRETKEYLLTRGMMLVFLEVIVIRLAWSVFDFTYEFTMVQVIWAIGWAMIFSSFLIDLKPKYLLVIGSGIIFLNGLARYVQPESLGYFSLLYYFLFMKKMFTPAPGHLFLISYPIFAWIGVMLVGIGIGKKYENSNRFSLNLIKTGFAVSTAFVILRFINIYGDPVAWSTQKNINFTIMSFFNLAKYPPSLFFLLMTLGPALILLGYFQKHFSEHAPNKILKSVILFGQVPLFFYVTHLFLLNYSSNIIGWLTTGKMDKLKLPLYEVYCVWIIVILALYYPCRWYLGKKQKHKKLLSYF